MPFEQSTDLIARCIADARREADALRAEADAAEANRDPEKVWVHVYYSGASRGDSGYRWTPTRLSVDPRLSRVVYHHPGDARPARSEPMPVFNGFTVAAAVRYCADSRAGYLRTEAAKRDTYADWQAARIADWAPAELTPVD